jgi:hypothetical protein
LIGIDKWEINNIFMAKFRLLQVRGGGEEEQHFMSKFRVPQVKRKIYHICMSKIRVPQVRGGYRYTTFVWLSLDWHMSERR